VEFKLFGSEKVPLGAVQVALVAPPLMAPDSVTEFPEQTVWDVPAFTTASGFMVITTVDATVVHGPDPSGSAAVNVNVTAPAEMSAALGLYTASSLDDVGEKLPLPLVVQFAFPLANPDKLICSPEHMVWGAPAFDVAGGLMVTVPVAVLTHPVTPFVTVTV
jgi:hypothetical protein